MIKISPNYFWPGLVIGLLCLSITLSFAGLYFATSDGGAQVIPDYYERSVEYDEEYQARAESKRLGWDVDVELHESDGELMVVDEKGEPVEQLGGTLSFYRPELAEPVDQVELHAVADRPGHYRFDDVTDRPGYWELAVQLQRDEDVFVDSLRVSVQ